MCVYSLVYFCACPGTRLQPAEDASGRRFKVMIEKDVMV